MTFDVATLLSLAEEAGYSREGAGTKKALPLKHERRGDWIYIDIAVRRPVIIVHPDRLTDVDALASIDGVHAMGDESAPFKHSTNIGQFPKRMHTGRSPISYGLAFRLDSAAAARAFLAELDSASDARDSGVGKLVAAGPAEQDIGAAKASLATLSRTERQAVINARLGQGAFRQALFDRCPACALTGCDVPAALRASHIKPWRDATNEERLDPSNGLLLRADIDALFDVGLITFDEDGKIVLSKNLGVEELLGFGLDRAARLRVEGHAMVAYLLHHRRHVFQDPV